MTSAFDSITEYVFAGKADRAESRAIARAELERMSKAMIEEEGLLNHAQAADVLGVSVKRVWELVRNEKLKRLDFAGRTYVSWKEVRQRCDDEVKAGERIKRSLGKRLVIGVKAALKTDEAQRELGGFAGAYHQDRVKKKVAKRKQEEEAARAETVKFIKHVLDPREPAKKKVKK